MGNQDQQPVARDRRPDIQAVPPVIHGLVNAKQADAPKLAISDQTAQALLTIQATQNGPKQRTGPSLSLLISLAVLVVIVVLASFLLSDLKPTGSSSTDSSTQSDTSSGGSTSNQINQDVNTCSNPVKALAEC